MLVKAIVLASKAFDINTWGIVGRGFVEMFGSLCAIGAMTFPNYKFDNY
jgi:hypothetical protein